MSSHMIRSPQERLLALPSETSLRALALILSITATSGYVFYWAYLSVPGLYRSLLHRYSFCIQGYKQSKSDPFTRSEVFAACVRQANLPIVWWVGLLLGAITLCSIAIYFAESAFRRRRLVVVDPGTRIADHIADLSDRSGLAYTPAVMTRSSLNVGALVFGTGRSPRLLLEGPLLAGRVTPIEFDAVVFHEFGHIRNRDIFPTYGGLAAWRVFLAVTLPVFLLSTIWHSASRTWALTWRFGWRIVLLVLLVALTRNAVLRSREFLADAWAMGWADGGAMRTVMRRLTPDGRLLGWFSRHPKPDARVDLLDDPWPLARTGFFSSFGLALSAMLTVTLATTLVSLFVRLEPAIRFSSSIVGVVLGLAVATSAWRAAAARAAGHQQSFQFVPCIAGLALGALIGLMASLDVAVQAGAGDAGGPPLMTDVIIHTLWFLAAAASLTIAWAWVYTVATQFSLSSGRLASRFVFWITAAVPAILLSLWFGQLLLMRVLVRTVTEPASGLTLRSPIVSRLLGVSFPPQTSAVVVVTTVLLPAAAIVGIVFGRRSRLPTSIES